MERSFFHCLRPGMPINIQQSTGAIHSAVIKLVSLEKKCVCVEWIESDITQRREIDLEDVLQLNPELFKSPDIPDLNEKVPVEENVTAQRQNRSATLSKIPVPREALLFQASKMSVVAESQSCPLENEMEVESTASLSTRRRSSIPVIQSRNPGTSYSSERCNVPPNDDEISEEPPQPHRVVPSASQAWRRSSIVKEMEKIKRKREEQRAQFAEIRSKRAQKFDNSCPNWEFAQMVKEYRATVDCRPISMNDPIEEHRICVCVRKRPLNTQELGKKECDIITVANTNTILVHEPKVKVDLTKYLENQAFRFDFSFDETASNEMVYWFTARPLVQTIFEGGKATCFAYGQTGSGKTHTMGGDFSGQTQSANKGIYALASQDVFLLLNQPKYKVAELEVYVAFFELYNAKLFDLLNKKAKLQILEDSKQEVQVIGLQEKQVSCAEDVIRMIELGSACRKGELYGKFSLVDLAGNERGADTSSADRQARMEAAEINKSLLALKECIRALGQNKAHTPFRESKLTQVLRDSFIGSNSRTCMIAMISPGMNSSEYTLNTLRYADRVKELPCSGTAGETHNLMEAENQGLEISEEGSKHLREVSEEELSPHLFSFREAITKIRELEEKAIEGLKDVQQKLNHSKFLLSMVEQPEHDLEAFVNQAQCFVQEGSQSFLHLKDTMDKLSLAMKMEEEASKHLGRKTPE